MKRLLLLVLLVLTAPAQAQEITTTVSPEAVVHGRDQEVTWRIRVRTGGAPAAIPLELTMRRSVGFLPTWIEQSAIRLEGPGQMQLSRQLIAETCELFRDVLPTYGLPRGHGTHTSSVGVDLQLPAGADSTLVVPAGIVADAPWPGMTYRLEVARLAPERTALPTPEATIGGRTGVPMSIDTQPASTDQVCQDASPPHPLGTTVAITGRADPGIAGDRVEILVGGPRAAAPPGVLGTAVVAADGSFSFDGWRPDEPGEYAVGARYLSQRGDRADDFAEPRMLTITPPPPVAAAGAARVSRSGWVSVALSCPAAAAAPCRGVVRLLRGRARVAREYELAAGAAGRVRLRLRARDRRTLRRHRRVAVALQHAPDGAAAVTERVRLRRR